MKEAIKKNKHSWQWQRPSLGFRQCQKCGRVLQITEHIRVGECPALIEPPPDKPEIKFGGFHLDRWGNPVSNQPPDSSRLLTDDEMLEALENSDALADRDKVSITQRITNRYKHLRLVQDAKTARVLEPEIDYWRERAIYAEEKKPEIRAKCEAEKVEFGLSVYEAAIAQAKAECRTRVKAERARVLKEVGEWLDSINFSDYDIEGVIASFQHYSVKDLKQGKAPWDSLKAGKEE